MDERCALGCPALLPSSEHARADLRLPRQDKMTAAAQLTQDMDKV